LGEGGEMTQTLDAHMNKKKGNHLHSLGLATGMTGFTPGNKIGTKIRVSNGKKTYKYQWTDHLVTVMNCEGLGTNEAWEYLINCLT
jgi:hypothetical protein